MKILKFFEIYIKKRTKATNGRYRPCKMTFFQNERRNVLYFQKFPSGIEVYRV